MVELVERRTLRDQVQQVIVDRIIDGTYEAGARIVESRIARELNVSQAPVREAIRSLAVLGFVHHEPRRGARVRRVDFTEWEDISQVRSALECLAIRLIAGQPPGRTFTVLREKIGLMHGAAELNDAASHVLYDCEFHEILVSAAGNLALTHAWKTLRIEPVALLSLLDSESDLTYIADSHLPILEALEAADFGRAESSLRLHIEDFSQRFRDDPDAHDTNGATPEGGDSVVDTSHSTS